MPGSDESEDRSEFIVFGGQKWNDFGAKTGRKKCGLFVSAGVRGGSKNASTSLTHTSQTDRQTRRQKHTHTRPHTPHRDITPYPKISFVGSIIMLSVSLA